MEDHFPDNICLPFRSLLAGLYGRRVYEIRSSKLRRYPWTCKFWSFYPEAKVTTKSHLAFNKITKWPAKFLSFFKCLILLLALQVLYDRQNSWVIISFYQWASKESSAGETWCGWVETVAKLFKKKLGLLFIEDQSITFVALSPQTEHFPPILPVPGPALPFLSRLCAFSLS